MLPARHLNHIQCAPVKQHLAHRPKKKTPRKAGFSEMDAWVNDNAAWTEYPRQEVVELTTGAP
jgi:hypothetical protein